MNGPWILSQPARLPSATPAPTSSGSTLASAAESPQTETVIPASLPALATPLTSARTRGWAASAGPAAWSRRPSPSTSPVRSLVPIEKKSTAGAKAAAFAAVDSSSTMIPRGGVATPSAAAVSVRTSRTRLTSRSELTIGISTAKPRVPPGFEDGAQLVGERGRMREQRGQAGPGRAG